MTSFNVEENDFIVIATDGLWDNLPDATILEEIQKIRVSDVSEMNDRFRRCHVFAQFTLRGRFEQGETILIVVVISEDTC